MRPDNIRHITQDIGQSFGIILLVNIFNILAARFVTDGIADVVNVKAQSLGQVVEPVELEFFRFHEWYIQFLPQWAYFRSIS